MLDMDHVPPCKKLSPKIDEMEQEMSDVVFKRIDCDEEDTEDALQEYSIMFVPSVILFKNKQKGTWPMYSCRGL